MIEIIDSYDQQTPEWFADTAGSIGGSSISTAVSNGTGRGDLIVSKAVEIITGKKSESKKLWQFKRGIEFEPKALIRYCMEYRIKVRQVAFVRNTDLTEPKYKHYSPDFFRDEDGFGEIKVREPHVFLKATDSKTITTSDRRQMQWGFNITHRAYCDYIQYCPEFELTDISPMFVMRIYPDKKEIRSLDDKCNGFIGDLMRYVKKKKGIS